MVGRARASDFQAIQLRRADGCSIASRIVRFGAFAFACALLYPLSGFLVPVGAWRWDGTIGDAVRVSLLLTAIAMIPIVVVGTPMALYVARCASRERLVWTGVLLISVLLPSLALGILLSLAFGPSPIGTLLRHVGIGMTNTPLAFVVTQIYVGIGYYVLAAIAAFDRVPRALEVQAGLLGSDPWRTFWRVTFPMASLGLAAALSLAWVRALTEFGAVVVTAYYPSGMPVALWSGLENYGLPAVMPLLAVFLATALPVPLLLYAVTLARRA